MRVLSSSSPSHLTDARLTRSMDAPNRAPRWIVTGVLGLAVLGTAGCGSSPATVAEAGPAVVVAGPAEPTVSRPPAPTGSLRASGGGSTAAHDSGDAKKVSAPSPQSARSPKSPPSAPTP